MRDRTVRAVAVPHWIERLGRSTIMPSKKSKPPQAGGEKNYRRWRKQLREAGLFGKRTSLRAKVSKSQKSKIDKYKDVISGKAKAVTMSEKHAREIRKLYGLQGAGGTVVVPKKKGERITFAKTKDEITITKKGGRKTVMSPDFKARLVPPGKRLFYTIEFARGSDTERYRFEDHEELIRFMTPYEQKPKNAWKNWRAYLVLDYLDKEEIAEARADGDVINTKRKPKSAKFIGTGTAGKFSKAASVRSGSGNKAGAKATGRKDKGRKATQRGKKGGRK